MGEEYKAATGKDWQPASGGAPAKSKNDKPSGGSGEDISAKVAAQGDKVRQLKADKAGKEQVQEAVKVLLQLKEEFKAATGKDWQPATAGGAPAKSKNETTSGGSWEDISAKVAAQ